jgi:hypothetical protein
VIQDILLVEEVEEEIQPQLHREESVEVVMQLHLVVNLEQLIVVEEVLEQTIHKVLPKVPVVQE